MKRPNILFFGTSGFSRLVLSELAEAGYYPEVFSGEVPPGEWDLFIVASYGKIIKKSVLDIPKYGALNVHPSLLPLLRGAAPLQWTILSGYARTGVTIMKMDEKMDHGPIVAVEEIEVSPRVTYQELHDMLAITGGKLLASSIPGFLSGEIVPRGQDHSKASLAPKLLTRDAELSFEKMPPEEIDRKVRALNPEPGAFAWFDTGTKKIRLLIKEGSLANEKYLPSLVQPEGKKSMSWDAFRRGHPNGKLL